MAVTRKFLKGMGLTDEQVDTIIEAHTETVDGLKDKLSKAEADAAKLADVQKELDGLKAGGDFKARYEKEHKDFEDYKAIVTAKESRAAKEAAVRAYYTGKGITGNNLEIAMRGSAAEIDAADLDGDKIKDPKALDELIGGTFKGLVGKTETRGTSTSTPPANNGGGMMTRAEIYKKDEHGRYVLSTAERQKALAENPELL
jgi:NADH dehydrogenase/NADH:ubiquinone oxidoreductase subunit G